MTLSNTLAQLETAGLVRLAQALPEIEYLFRHDMVHVATYASLLRQDRKRLHASLVEVLEQLYQPEPQAHAALLAYHCLLGAVWTKAAAYSMIAGAHALRVNALREAMGHYEHALQAQHECPDTAAEQVYDCLIGWAQAAFRFTPYAEQLERLHEAESIARGLHDTRRLVQVLSTIGNVHRASGHNLRAVSPLAECFTLAQQLDDERLLVDPTYNMGMLVMDTQPQYALRLLDQAILLARKYGAKDIEAYALGARGMILSRLGDADRAHHELAEAQRVVAGAESLMAQSDIDLFTGWAYLDLGDVQRSLEYSQRGIAEALAAENVDCVCYGYACMGFGRLQSQQLAEATEAFEESIRHSRFSGAQQVESIALSGLAITHLIGHTPGALQEAEQVLVEAEKNGNPFVTALLSQAVGEVYARAGHADVALRRLNQAADYFRRTQMPAYLQRAEQAIAHVNPGSY